MTFTPADDFLVLDVETANNARHSICQIGWVRVTPRGLVDHTSILVDPRGGFTNTFVHGIAARHVAGQPSYDRLHGRLRRLLEGRIVVAHSSFDKGAFAAAATLHALEPIACHWIDSIRIARAAWPGRPGYGLKALAEFHGIRFRHHDGLADATATAQIVQRALAELGLPIHHWLSPPRAPRPRGPGGLRDVAPLTG